MQDDLEILGLEYDYNTLKTGDKDNFELHLRNLVNNNYGKEFATTHLKIAFPILDEKEICDIEIKKGNKPLYLEVIGKNGQKQKKFYVRSGNSSQELEIDEVASYVKNRFETIWKIWERPTTKNIVHLADSVKFEDNGN